MDESSTTSGVCPAPTSRLSLNAAKRLGGPPYALRYDKVTYNILHYQFQPYFSKLKVHSCVMSKIVELYQSKNALMSLRIV